MTHAPKHNDADAAPPLPVDQARERIVANVQPVEETETVALADALHRVLAESVRARVDVPSADNASMDGYALGPATEATAADGYRLAGASLAGHPFAGEVAPGACVRITTGAAIPAGADRVVMQENTRVDTADVVFVDPVPSPHENIRPAGEDLARGAEVLAAGRWLTPADIAVLASAGLPRVTVYRRPRVAFFSTGDELRPIDGPLQPGEIYDSNRQGLAASLAELGMDGVDLGAIADDPAALAAAFGRAADCDALITSGGVSVGDADHVLDVLGEQGCVEFWRVAIKPGKPLAFGRVGRALFFGLPGNPVSTAVTFVQLVRPALVRLAGARPAPTVGFWRATTAAIDKRAGRAHYLRGRLDPAGETVTPLSHQGSGVMHSMSRADAFIVLAADAEDVAAGEAVWVEPFAQPIWNG